MEKSGREGREGRGEEGGYWNPLTDVWLPGCIVTANVWNGWIRQIIAPGFN